MAGVGGVGKICAERLDIGSYREPFPQRLAILEMNQEEIRIERKVD